MQEVFNRTKALTDTPFHYCPGCTHGIIHRLVAENLAEMNLLEQAIGVTPVGCAGFCEQYFDVDFVAAAHGRAPAVATGVKRSQPDKFVFTYQGDGDLASIGIAEIIHAAARGEKFTTIFVNNAIYGMTGGQMAPTTLLGQKTTTSPFGREQSLAGYPLDVPPLIAQIKGAAYVASVSVDCPKNIIQAKKAIRRAFEIQQEGLGFTFVSVLSTCPTNWGMAPVKALEWLRANMMENYTLGILKEPTEK